MNVHLPLFGHVEVSEIATQQDTNISTAATVGQMQAIIQAACQHPDVIAAAHDALVGLPADAPAVLKAQAIYAWVQSRCRFVPDEDALAHSFHLGPDYELLIRPELFLRVRRGDCDDYTMLTCALARVAGLACRIVTIAADRQDPQRFSHVYAAIEIDGALVPCDTTPFSPYLGWEAPAFRRLEWAS